MTPARHRVLYDADCGFCRWSLAWILRWDRRRELEPVALQATVAGQLTPSMDEDERMASWHLVAPDGAVTSGGWAAAPMLRLLPGGGPLAAAFDRAPRVVERAYDWVSRRRGVLGRAITDRGRERAERVIASRTGVR